MTPSKEVHVELVRDVPIEVMWLVAIGCLGLFVARFAALMPSWGFRLRVVVGAVLAPVAGLMISDIREYPTRVALLTIAVSALAISLASLGEGVEIRDTATKILDRPEEEEDIRVPRRTEIKLIAIPVVAFVGLGVLMFF